MQSSLYLINLNNYFQGFWENLFKSVFVGWEFVAIPLVINQFYFANMEIDSRSKQQEPMPPAQQHHDSDHYLVYHNRQLKCVCELCTCGKHHCPRPKIKGDFSTSYADHYKNIQYKQQPQPRGDYHFEQRHYNPEALRTSYQDTYIKPQQNNFIDSPSRLENIGSKLVYQVPFMGSSSYKDQYKPYAIKPAANPQQFDYREQKLQKSPGQNYRPPQIKFQGVSSYKSQFVEPPKVQSKPIPQDTYQKAQIPFYGETSYKKDFPEYKIAPTRINSEEISASQVRMPTVKFEGSSSYKDQYKGYQFKTPERDMTRSSHQCIVQKLPVPVPSVNYINDKQHIYYDPQSHKFI